MTYITSDLRTRVYSASHTLPPTSLTTLSLSLTSLLPHLSLSPSPLSSLTSPSPSPLSSLTSLSPSPLSSLTSLLPHLSPPSPLSSLTSLSPSPLSSLTSLSPSPLPHLSSSPLSLSLTSLLPHLSPSLTSLSPSPLSLPHLSLSLTSLLPHLSLSPSPPSPPSLVGRQETRKLWRHIEPYFRGVMSKIYLREISRYFPASPPPPPPHPSLYCTEHVPPSPHLSLSLSVCSGRKPRLGSRPAMLCRPLHSQQVYSPSPPIHLYTHSPIQSFTHSLMHRSLPVQECVGAALFLKVPAHSFLSRLLQPFQDRQEILLKGKPLKYIFVTLIKNGMGKQWVGLSHVYPMQVTFHHSKTHLAN